jgi:hypothetical protein
MQVAVSNGRRRVVRDRSGDELCGGVSVERREREGKSANGTGSYGTESTYAVPHDSAVSTYAVPESPGTRTVPALFETIAKKKCC